MHRDTQQADQRGIVSFMVTLIMMMVISLIVIGFTQVTMRSRREALDKQLSSQAFYAAESGVNKVVSTIKQDLIDNQPIAQQNNCTDSTYSSFQLDPNNVEVTCIMVNTLPKSIVGKATKNASFVTYVNPTQALSELTFTWSPPDNLSGVGSTCNSPFGTFDKTSNGCAFGLLRVDMYNTSKPVADPGATTTFYMQPINGASVPRNITNATSGGILVHAGCTEDTCTATLKLDNSISDKKFYLRISTLYRDSKSVVITGNSGVHFEGAQAVIDATGRAQDVLRRVQVRYPLGQSDDTPPWAVAGRVCKRLTVVPATSVSISSPCDSP